MIVDIIPRKYQQKIAETCKKKNCLVVLPTGTGKTLVALMLAVDRMKKYPDKKILFLAPTRPLAEQHLAYFKKYLPELFGTLELFTGKINAENRKKLWQRADVVFSTPQCIANDLKNNLYDLKETSLVIFDECHRCLKNYAYTYVAQQFQQQSKNSRILGLTASPGSEKKIIKEICKNLNVQEVEIRTRDSDDVKEYLQDLKFNVIQLDFPVEFDEIRKSLKKIFDKKINELKNRKLLFKPGTKKYLLELQGNLMKQISSGNRNFNVLSGVSACAQVIKLQHLLELLETQTLQSSYVYMNDLFSQGKTGKTKAASSLIKQTEFTKAYTLLTELITKKAEHPKLQVLREIVESEIKKNKKAKTIVFAQYRESVIRICKELNSIQDVNARVFVGQAKKGETGLSQKEQQEMIRDFSLGKINVICSTSIGEEGLDIPEVNAVVFYEPVPSAIRKIQRAGRTARLMPGKLIILLTKKTRDEAYYWAAFNKEKKMHSAISGIKKELNKNNNLGFEDKEEVGEDKVIKTKKQKTLDIFD